MLDLRAWARDALALALAGEQILCRADCAGLCPVCGENLNTRPRRRPATSARPTRAGPAARAEVRVSGSAGGAAARRRRC